MANTLEHDSQKTVPKSLEEMEEAILVGLKISSGVSLLDASVVQDRFLDLYNHVTELKKELLQ